MRRSFLNFITFLFIAVSFATAYTVQAQVRAYRVTDRQVRTLINRIETRTDVFRSQLERSLDRSILNSTRSEDAINTFVADFERATDNLRRNFDARRSTSADIEEVLVRANFIENFMRRNRLNANVQRQWILVRNDLNLLANYFNVSWTWGGTMTTTSPVSSTRPYTVSDIQLQNLLTRIEQRTDVFKRQASRSLDQSTINGTRSEDSINRFIADFENATDRLRQRFDARQSVDADVEAVLMQARMIDNFVRDNRLSVNAETQWSLLRNDLNTLASYYQVNWDWNRMDTNINTGRTVNVSPGIIQSLLSRLENNTDVFKRDLSFVFTQSVLNNTRSQEALMADIAEFERATDNLRQKALSNRAFSTDVEEVLNRAYFIDTFMRDYRFPVNVESRWATIRTDLDNLANYFNVRWNWVRPNVPPTRLDASLTGTYRLNVSQSDSVREVVNRAINSFYVSDRERERIRQNLERRLTSPEMIVIEKNNNQVTIASTLSPQIVFDADGRIRTETDATGRQVRVSANTTYDGVSLSYEGDRMNDFYVNFMPLNNNQLRVIRRIFLENRNETVTVASIYDKISQHADFSRVYNSNTAQNFPGGVNTTINNEFVVPNGTQLVATLTRGFSTATANEGDRFTMEVRSPGQYEGAIIEGHVSNTQKSGRVSGRAQVTFNFDTIRLRNGNTYRFSGLIDQVRQPNGETISVTNEGAVRDNNQTTRTITRAGIGAAIGAIIGAITGGGQGAAIGAGIGAGAGAGTVILQGRDNLELQTGAEFTITSSAPANMRSNF